MLAQLTPPPSASEIGISSLALAIIGFGLVLAFLLLGWYVGWRWTNRSTPGSLYGGGELLRGDEIGYQSVVHLHNFLQSLPEAWRPEFELNRAAVCRTTGRIFPDSVNRFGELRLSWNFLKRCHRGRVFSWGSVSPQEKLFFERAFPDISRFQTVESSQRSRPRDLERHYALLKPGPLYVDPQSGTLIGWLCVPNTDLEVLVLRRR